MSQGLLILNSLWFSTDVIDHTADVENENLPQFYPFIQVYMQHTQVDFLSGNSQRSKT